MTGVLQDVHARTDWIPGTIPILRQVITGLRSLTLHGECLYADPIRDPEHAHHVMAIHAGHRCQRYQLAADYAIEARP